MNLFDIVLSKTNPDNFTEDENQFYKGQNSPERTGCISDKIDEQYEQLKSEDSRKQKKEKEQTFREMEFINELLDQPEVSATSSTSKNASIGFPSHKIALV